MLAGYRKAGRRRKTRRVRSYQVSAVSRFIFSVYYYGVYFAKPDEMSQKFLEARRLTVAGWDILKWAHGWSGCS